VANTISNFEPRFSTGEQVIVIGLKDPEVQFLNDQIVEIIIQANNLNGHYSMIRTENDLYYKILEKHLRSIEDDGRNLTHWDSCEWKPKKDSK
jgi:hypothetical protein